MTRTRMSNCADCGKAESVRYDNPRKRCVICNSRVQIKRAQHAVKVNALARKYPCATCKSLIVHPAKFCSVDCRVAYTAKIERVCQYCGNLFVVLASTLPPINMTTNAVGKYCTRACYAEARRGTSKLKRRYDRAAC